MGGRDHSCEGCGRGGLNDPDGRCECDPGVWHKDGPLAQIETMAAWADRIAAEPHANARWEDAQKIAANLRAALSAVSPPRTEGPGRAEIARALYYADRDSAVSAMTVQEVQRKTGPFPESTAIADYYLRRADAVLALMERTEDE